MIFQYDDGCLFIQAQVLMGKKFMGSGVGMFIWSYQASTGGFQKMRVITFIQWWRLTISLANHNELLSLELSCAWEPMYS